MYIKIKVFPKSRKEKIEKKTNNSYIIAIKDRAERNLANNRVREIISSIYGVEKSKVSIISGQRSQNKILAVNI